MEKTAFECCFGCKFCVFWGQGLIYGIFGTVGTREYIGLETSFKVETVVEVLYKKLCLFSSSL